MLKNIISLEQTDSVIRIDTDGPEIRIILMTDDIIRVRASYDRVFAEQSYALLMTAWNDRLDGFLGSMRTRIVPVRPDVVEHDAYYELSTKTLVMRINKNPYRLEIYGHDGKRIYSDLAGRAYRRDRRGRVYHYSEIDQEHDCFYGFGEAAGPLDKKFRVVRQAPRDSYAYDAELSSALYKHIPFYLRINRRHPHAFGLFYHNTFESLFDLGCERSGYWPRYSYFCADGGDIDMFFINGPSVPAVVGRYTDLTGNSAMAPMDALGYLGSTMYYVELEEKCDERILGFVDTCASEGIPVSNFHLSSGYTTDERTRKRFVFTWNGRRFNNPDAFFAAMTHRGVSVTANVKPGLLIENPHYELFDEARAFVRTADGSASYVDRWWGGPGSFVDFTNPDARALWKRLLGREIIDRGTVCVWNDNCEYDSLDDRDAACSFDGAGGIIDELKPVQSLIMAHVAHEAVHESRPHDRPFIVSRSGFAGLQRYASTWSGDNRTSWHTLKFNIATMLGMGLSGVAVNGCDTGGFAGPAPDEELLVRWVQNSVFHPRFSIHSCNSDNTVTEPWMYSGATGLIRDAILLRYSLMPYLYSLLHEAHVHGYPMARPLFYEFPEDAGCYDIFDEFMLGPSLLVATVIEQGAKKRTVYFPRGCDWYCWHTRGRYAGGTTVDIDVTMESVPLFIRDSAVIPAAIGFTDINRQKIDHVHIIITADADTSFTLFEDDGKTFAYKDGGRLLTRISVRKGSTVGIAFEKDGAYRSSVKQVLLDVVRPGKSPVAVAVHGRRIAHYLNRTRWEQAAEGWYYSHTGRAALVKYPEQPHSYSVEVDFGNFDLLGM